MSFRTETNTFGIELPRFTYAVGFNPCKPSTSLSTSESMPSSTEGGIGPKGSYIKRLMDEEGRTLEEAMAIANADTIDADDDERLYDLIEKYNDPEFLRERLALKNQFDAEAMAAAAPYNLMYQIPRTLTQAAVLPATVALGSAKTATDALASMGGINLGGSAINPKAGGYF